MISSSKDKKSKKLTLNINILEPGDVILTRSNEFQSMFIQTTTGSRYSHACIVISKHLIIESDSHGVHGTNPTSCFFENKEDAIVLRYKSKLTQIQKKKIEAWARERIGAQYTVPGAISAGFIRVIGRNFIDENSFNQNTWGEKQFCSKLVSEAYYSAGISISKEVGNPTPGCINNPLVFDAIEDCLILADEEDVRYRENIGSIQPYMYKITQDILGRFRSLVPKEDSKTIQNFNDAWRYLKENPNLDNDFTNAFLESDYYKDPEGRLKSNIVSYFEYFNCIQCSDKMKEDLARYYSESPRDLIENRVSNLYFWIKAKEDFPKYKYVDINIKHDHKLYEDAISRMYGGYCWLASKNLSSKYFKGVVGISTAFPREYQKIITDASRHYSEIKSIKDLINYSFIDNDFDRKLIEIIEKSGIYSQMRKFYDEPQSMEFFPDHGKIKSIAKTALQNSDFMCYSFVYDLEIIKNERSLFDHLGVKSESADLMQRICSDLINFMSHWYYIFLDTERSQIECGKSLLDGFEF